MADMTQSWDSWKRADNSKSEAKKRKPKTTSRTAAKTAAKKVTNKRAVSSRGATPTPQKTVKQNAFFVWIASPMTWRIIFVLFIGMAISIVSWKWYENSSQTRQTHFSINEVEVTGNYEYLDMNKVSSLIHGYSDGDFFNVDIDKLREALIALPWVREVALRREWPNKLVVELYEQQAVAIWTGHSSSESAEKQLLNDQGEMFQGVNQIDISKYPVLAGADNRQFEVLKEYANLYARLKTQGVNIIGLSVDKRNTWTGVLAGGLTFHYLGKSRSLALTRLEHALTKFSPNEIKEIESIDLRYSNGFALAKKAQVFNPLALDPKS